MLLRSNFSSFPHYFIYIFLTSGVKLHIHLLNVVVQFIVFLTLSTLICQSTDISKCFSESLGIQDNESRLYFTVSNDSARGNVLIILCECAGYLGLPCTYTALGSFTMLYINYGILPIFPAVNLIKLTMPHRLILSSQNAVHQLQNTVAFPCSEPHQVNNAS